MDKKVSIIVPIYNTPQKLLEECLTSVERQTYKNFECIVIDDGSTDSKLKEYLLEWTKDKTKFNLFLLEKNIGLGEARNYGVEKSSGEIIVFLDSDDYLDLRAVENISQKFCEYTDLDFYWFDMIRINEIKKRTEIDDYSFKTSIVNIDSFPNAFLIQKMAWLKAYSKKFLMENKIHFLKRWIHCEDVYYNIVVLSKAKRFIIDNSKNYFYRVHSYGLEGSPFTPKKAADLLENVVEAFDFIKNDENCITKNLFKWFNFFFYYEISYRRHNREQFEYKIVYEKAAKFHSSLKK